MKQGEINEEEEQQHVTAEEMGRLVALLTEVSMRTRSLRGGRENRGRLGALLIIYSSCYCIVHVSVQVREWKA